MTGQETGIDPGEKSRGESGEVLAPTEGSYLAAVDLGSNSFHMVVAREVQGQAVVLDRLRERVALAEGLQADGSLSKEVEARALECLGRFGQRIAEISPSRVRAVGTATLREMRSTRSFLERAGRALGHEIEVLAGREEARMIYLGVAHAQGDDEGTRLVIDIGGGSTECILGRRFEAAAVDSLSMGCIPWSARYFPRGALSRDAFEEAEIAARIEFETIEGAYREHGWRDCFGSSGTILAVDEMLTRAGWSEGGITERGLAKLEKAMIAAGKIEKLELEGLKPDRKPVLAGGLAILRAAFDALGIARMQASKGALREGLLYDLMGRIYHEDVRERAVRAFAARYRVDEEQAERVAKTALALFDGVSRSWGLDPGARQALNWSAALHEVGLTVSYAGYHRHGAYLIANSDLPGFSRDDQDRLAALVQLQRGKLDEAILAALPSPRARAALRLAVLLRLAVRLHRSRRVLVLPTPALAETRGVLRMQFPYGWLDAHPLTRADLALERAALSGIGLELEIV
jgi:exopolyphosphatase/guanosine-5'-triphosphate,3'-diphosphate pyrophosphatase